MMSHKQGTNPQEKSEHDGQAPDNYIKQSYSKTLATPIASRTTIRQVHSPSISIDTFYDAKSHEVDGPRTPRPPRSPGSSSVLKQAEAVLCLPSPFFEEEEHNFPDTVNKAAAEETAVRRSLDHVQQIEATKIKPATTAQSFEATSSDNQAAEAIEENNKSFVSTSTETPVRNLKIDISGLDVPQVQGQEIGTSYYTPNVKRSDYLEPHAGESKSKATAAAESDIAGDKPIPLLGLREPDPIAQRYRSVSAPVKHDKSCQTDLDYSDDSIVDYDLEKSAKPMNSSDIESATSPSLAAPSDNQPPTPARWSNTALYAEIRRLGKVVDDNTKEQATMRRELEVKTQFVETMARKLREKDAELSVWRNRAEWAETKLLDKQPVNTGRKT